MPADIKKHEKGINCAQRKAHPMIPPCMDDLHEFLEQHQVMHGDRWLICDTGDDKSERQVVLGTPEGIQRQHFPVGLWDLQECAMPCFARVHYPVPMLPFQPSSAYTLS